MKIEPCLPPPDLMAEAEAAERRKREALDRLLEKLPAPYPKPTLLAEHMAMYALIEADERRAKR